MKRLFSMILTLAFLIGISGISSAAREPAIYDGDVKQLISAINEEARTFGINLRGFDYFTKNEKRYCVSYIGEGQNEWIGFRLNDDNSVIYAYLVMKYDYDTHKFASPLSMSLLVSVCDSVGISSHEFLDLLEQVTGKEPDTSDPSMYKGTAYRYCSSISKNVYVTLRTNFDQSRGEIILGVAN